MTDHGFGVVRPLPGNGLVAHTGGLLLVCDAAEAVVSDLLAAVRETAATGGDGRALARRVAQALARSMTTEPASCAVAGPANGGVAVLVSGEASATVKAESGEVTLAGRDALTWTDRLVPGPVHHVELHLPGAGEAHPQARLDSGVVVGGGLSCDRTGTGQQPIPSAGASAAAPEPPAERRLEPEPPDAGQTPSAAAPPPPAPEPAASAVPEPPYPLGGDHRSPSAQPQPGPGYGQGPSGEPFATPPTRDEPPEPAPVPQPAPEPAPAAGEQPVAVGGAPDAEARERGFESVPPPPDQVETEPDASAEPQAESGSRPLVYGVDCKNGHFNDPRVPYCAVCGIALVQRTLTPYKGPRPPLGVLLLDDGMTLTLDTDYLLGRDPERAAEVTSGKARPAKVTSPDGSVSRRHLRVALDGWDVNLIDLGSVNGTQIQPPGDPNFYDIPPNEPVSIMPGTTIRIGVSRTMRYESHRTH